MMDIDVKILIKEGLPVNWEVLSGQEALDFLEREESKMRNDPSYPNPSTRETEIPWWFYVGVFSISFLVVCWMKRHE